MICDYAYAVEGPAVEIRGNLQVAFQYYPGYKGAYGWHDDACDYFYALADSADIIDGKGAVVGRVELLTEEQKARWGAVVLKDCREAIEEACIQSGRVQSTAEARGHALADHSG